MCDGSVSLSVFLVASFDGLGSLPVASHCSFRSLANKLRSFARVEGLLVYLTSMHTQADL